MKKVVLLSLAALLSSGLMFAQGNVKTTEKQSVKKEQSQKNKKNARKQGNRKQVQGKQKGQYQQQQRVKRTPTERAAEMQKEYNLTSQQTKELIAFYEKQDKQRSEMRSYANQKREDIQKQREANQQELKRILGEENYNKMIAKKRAEFKGEMKNNQNVESKDKRENDQNVNNRKGTETIHKDNKPVSPTANPNTIK